jgi:hypothetical protein
MKAASDVAVRVAATGASRSRARRQSGMTRYLDTISGIRISSR